MFNKYPKVNFIGNKEKIASWICDYFPNDATSVFDAFSGGCSLSYEAKQRGFEVYANDILDVNFQLSKAIIENNSILLDENDIKFIFSGEPFEGFMYKNYSKVFFFPDECKELDLYRVNIEKLNSEYKKAIALSLLRRSMIRKMPYSRFNLTWNNITQLRDEEYSYQKMIDECLSLFDSKTNAERKAKSRFKAKIEYLIDYLYMNEKDLIEQQQRNTEAYKYIEQMFFLNAV